MPKRKAEEHVTADNNDADGAPLRRSTRHRPAAAAVVQPVESSPTTPKKKKTEPKEEQQKQTPTAATSKKPLSANKSKKSKGEKTVTDKDDGDEEKTWYWLMKAEPDSRFENGVDVKFSIDDLAAKSEPEPWDGIRNYMARNNLRAMKKGEKAFFYHSNCKEPGIVGTMEIVQEHSPDLSAHDSKCPYYDASSKPSDPKWSVVHVVFRSKFARPIGLKELRTMGEAGQPLENMQMLRQSRLSVSRVSPAEWEYLISVARERGGEKTAS